GGGRVGENIACCKNLSRSFGRVVGGASVRCLRRADAKLRRAKVLCVKDCGSNFRLGRANPRRRDWPKRGGRTGANPGGCAEVVAVPRGAPATLRSAGRAAKVWSQAGRYLCDACHARIARGTRRVAIACPRPPG